MARNRVVSFGGGAQSSPLAYALARNPQYSFGAQTLSDAAGAEPVQSVGEGLTKLGRALLGGVFMNQAVGRERERSAESGRMLAEAMRSGDPSRIAALAGNPETQPFALQIIQGQQQREQAQEDRRQALAERQAARDPWVVIGETAYPRAGLEQMFGQGQPQPGMPQAQPGAVSDGRPNPTNPGNMRVPGQTAFQRFDSPEAGVAGMVRQLQLYGQRGITTPAQIVATWAPRGDGPNNPEAYARSIQQITGLAPDQPVDMSNPQTMARLVAAMAQVEQGRPVDPAVIVRGVQMAYGGSQAPAGGVQAAPLPPMAGVPSAMPSRLPGTSGVASPVMTDAGPAAPPQPGTRMAQAPQGAPSTGVMPPRPTVTEIPGVGRALISPRSPQSQVTIDQRAGQAMVEIDRDRLKAMQEATANDRRTLATLQRMEQAIRNVPEGLGAQWLPQFGQAARALGIDIPGTSEAEAAQAIQSILTGLARTPGSGATSDFEQRLYMQSVPRLGNTREGNMQLIDMGRRLAQRRLQETQLARTVMRRDGNLDRLDDELEALGPVFTPRDIETLTATVSQPSGAAPQQSGRPRARNPQTGAEVEYDGRAWVPVR